MQMTNHEVGNLVSAINKPKNQWKIKGKVERMRCSRRQEEKHGKSAKQKFRKLFANQFRNAKISQTSFAMRKFRKPNSQCENFAMRNFAMPKPISQCQFQFRNAKISQCEISQCQSPFRNANSNFAMRKFRNAKISQCEISQCQSPFRIAKFTAFAKFTLRNFQALSSSVINAEPPSIFGLLLFCPIT